MTRSFVICAAFAASAVLAAAGSGLADPRFDGGPHDRNDGRRGGEMRRDGFEPPRSHYPGPDRAAESPNSLGSDWRQQQEEARFGVKRGRMAPLGQVIGEIARRAPGRQLDAGIEDVGGRPVYRVRWITANGRRVDYIVDAATGTILGEH